MKKTALVICIILAVLLTFSACAQSDSQGAAAGNNMGANDDSTTRTILLCASGAHAETPLFSPVSSRLNKMMEAEIPEVR